MSVLGSAVVLIWNDVVDSARVDFYEWHNKEHIPERLALDGFLRGRRFRGADASPEWLTVYEAAGLDVLTGHAYLERLNHPTPATLATVKHFRNTTRALCRIAHSAGQSNGAFVVTARLQPARAEPDDALDAFVRQRFAELLTQPDVVASHLFAADLDASHVQTNEARQRGGAGDVPARIAMIECTTEAGARAAARRLGEADWQHAGASLGAPQVYGLEISRQATPS